MNYNPNQNEVKKNIEAKLARHFGCTSAEASREQMYKATALTVKDILAEKRGDFKKRGKCNRLKACLLYVYGIFEGKIAEAKSAQS